MTNFIGNFLAKKLGESSQAVEEENFENEEEEEEIKGPSPEADEVSNCINYF